MSNEDRDTIISEISDEYKMAKMLGKDPDIQEYLKRCPPECMEELKEDIENWEWLVGWKYEGSAEDIDPQRIENLIVELQPQLDSIDSEWEMRQKRIREPAAVIQVTSKIIEDFSAWLTALFGLHPQQRLVIAVANPIGVKARIRLLEEAAKVMQDSGYQTTLPKIELLRTYLDINSSEQTNSQGDEDRKAHFLLDATKFANLNEAFAKIPGHIIAIGQLREWETMGKETAPDRFYPLRISDDDRQSLQKAAVECYQAIGDALDIMEPIRLVLALGAFGVLTPVSLLASAVKESADKLIERLNTPQIQSLVMPIHPSGDTVPAEVGFFTATSEFMAAAALDSAGVFTEVALSDTFSELIGAALADSGKSAEEKSNHTATVVRLLYSLVLNSRRRLAYNLIEQHSENLEALQDSADDVRYLHSWAKIYRGVGYRRAKARAEELYKLALGPKRDNIYLLSAYATFLAEQGRYYDSEQLFQRIRELGEIDNIYVLTAWADMLLKRGRGLADARRVLEEACELEPDNPYPLQMLGILEERQLHFRSAGEFFEKALKADPNNIPTLHAQAHMARERGQLQKAEELLQRILGMEPDNVRALVELGCVYSKRTGGGAEAEQKARSCFQKALEVDDENLLALTAWADLDIEAGNYDRAKAYLEKAERIAGQTDSDATPIITTRAKLARKQQDQQLAEGLLESLRDSRNVVALNMLVQLYWKRGEENRATRLFTGVRHHIGLTPRSLNNFAMLLAEDGRFEDSESWYKESLRIDSENAHTQLDYGRMLMDWAEASTDEELRREKVKLAREAIDKANSLGLTTQEKETALARIQQLESA